MARPDKYQQLINRFYEPLILLEALGKVRGSLTPRRKERDPEGIRRQFRDDLAFLCEYTKGGDACTAIGIEDRPQCAVYWVAANVDPESTIVPFLISVLEELRNISKLPGDQRQDRTERVATRCIVYAEKKVIKLKRLLSTQISECSRRLEGSTSDLELVDWLQQFERVRDHVALCKLAYELRKSESMKRLKRLSEDPTYHRDPDGRLSPFSQVRHYVGRLAEHIRVPQRLIEELGRLEDLLLNPFQVQVIPVSSCIPPPRQEERDDRGIIDSICIRMLPKDSPDLPNVRAWLTELDRMYHIIERVEDSYKNPNFRPRVHAEIQVLEHFHSRGLTWLDGDRYIGCSKPACFLCHLYLRHHPARPVEPESHRKIYLNWGPPLLAKRAQDESYLHQRDILNKMVEEIRKDALEQIRQRQGPQQWHADSHTAITTTVADAALSSLAALSLQDRAYTSTHAGSFSEQGTHIHTSYTGG